VQFLYNLKSVFSAKRKMKIQDLKQYPIVSYLQSVGIEPVQSKGNELVYHSPKTKERTPSFFVNLSKNVFYCYSSGRNGDILTLIQYLEGVEFSTACNLLASLVNGNTPQNSFSFSGNKEFTQNHDTAQNTIKIDHVKPLQSNALIAYCESRKIPFQIAFKFLHEVHYTNDGKAYYSLGFKNDKGGYELRNQHFKGCTAPKAITTIEAENSKGIYLFEGFFDFLSALAFFGTSKPLNTVVVLNSLVNLPQAKETLNKAEIVHCFLDRDKQGIATVEKLKADGLNIIDRSIIYTEYKDFNEYLNR
jgi:DNA primase